MTARQIATTTTMRCLALCSRICRSFCGNLRLPMHKIGLSKTEVNAGRKVSNVFRRGIQFQTLRSVPPNDNRSKTAGIIPGVFLGLAGFSLFSKEEPEKEKEEDPLIILLKWAKLYELRHDLQQASDYYHEALALLLEREQGSEWTDEQVLEGKVYIYDGMANAAFAMFKLDEAEKLYKETIKGLLQQNKGKDDDAVIEISLKLATIYTIERRFDEATDGYQYCLKLLNNKLKTVNRDTIRLDDPEDESGNLNSLALLGMCSTSYGRFLIVRSKYNEAYDALSNALNIAKQVFGEDDNQVAVLNNDLATVASHLNDFTKAKEHALSAIQVGKTIQSDDLAMFHCNMCYICLDMKQWDEGRKSGRTALRLARNRDEKDIAEQAANCLKEIKEKFSQT